MNRFFLKKVKEFDFSNMDDGELRSEFFELKNDKKQLARKVAVCKEVIKRTTGLELFDVQLIGAVDLLRGNIVEMKTGEGKTIVAVLTSLLRYLEGGKTHVITVNDYLAERDGTAAQATYGYLGLKAEYIVSEKMKDRKQKYDEADVLYITNSELGFDYLRSNGAYRPEDIVFNIDNALAIVDEADSILIDEAKIPLILSASKKEDSNKYNLANAFVEKIKNDSSLYEVDKKDRQAFLTEKGCRRAEKFFSIGNYSDAKNTNLRHLITEALIAHLIMECDKDYIVYKGEIKLIDQSTGRIAEGRRYNRGLHQAIEAKEKVPVKQESATIATITYQHLFNMYPKLSGMTGTAYSEKKEFKEIYKLKVIKLPTNEPMIRKDRKDLLFASEIDRNKYLTNYVKEEVKRGRPILIGTSSIEESEKVSKALNKAKIKHQVLNAKNHELEAAIIAEAGNKKTVTVATNMAGRGTDIKLAPGVAELGGLLLIGIGHYENVRIDNQLRGRSGRQGDPGESIFLVSMDDELVNIFAGDMLKNLIKNLSKDNDGKPIENRSFSKAIKSAQKQIQVRSFNQRKSTIEYDEILGKYRDLYYKERYEILTTKELGKLLIKLFDLDENIQIDSRVEMSIKQKMLAIMDEGWMDILRISDDLRSEAAYSSYAGTQAIVTYEQKMAEYYEAFLITTKEKIKETFKFVEDIPEKEQVKEVKPNRAQRRANKRQK